ncbi:MAG TPA: glycosyltransferase family 4 protein, partial [Pelolinea sp.]|nr:glycosyltransferase family 4 protein [Pelolinea sp.]
MKILVISHEYPPVGGGGGKVVQDLCQNLARRGHQIHLLTTNYGELPKLEESENYLIERLSSWRTQAFRADIKAMGMFVWKSYRRGLELARSWKPNLIHAHFAVPAGATAYYLWKITGISYVITAHGGDVPGGAPEKTGRWFRFVLPFSKTIWKHSGAVAAVSQQTRELALAHYQANIRVIPNGIDTKSFNPQNLEPNSPPKILFIGRFSPEKNAIVVPQILANLSHLDWECEMLGDGIQMKHVKHLIEEKGLSERVKLTGWVNPEEVMDWMEKSDILLMPSLREGMPIAGLQGLAMGLVLVISRTGSCPDLIEENENGFLVQPGDI